MNDVLSNEEIAEWICDWKIMPKINIEMIPLIFYDFLEANKIVDLSNGIKWDYFKKAIENVKSKLQQDIGSCKTNNAYLAYIKFELQEKTVFDKEFSGRIKNKAKRLIVFDYLKDNL